MTDRAFGQGTELFVAKVVNRKDDKLKAGRVQIRVFGLHDNTTLIPDKDLPWAYPMAPITSASRNHIGDAPVGPIEDSIVVGFWMDADKQIPLVIGTINRSVIEKK